MTLQYPNTNIIIPLHSLTKVLLELTYILYFIIVYTVRIIYNIRIF